MQIFVDADACPVVDIVETIAEKYNISTTLLCDTNHILYSDYSEVIVVSAGADAVDYKLINMAPEGKLLPMYSNNELNRTLKRIAAICGIERKLVFHCGRHTYATEITLSHGVPLETVSKMLGHSRISTTQIYAKVTDDKIDMDTRSLEEKIADRFSVAI